MLQIQHESNKSDSYRSFAPIEWSESLQCWCVFDADLIVSILKSPDFAVVNYAEEYARLEHQTGIDFACLTHALDHIPLANEGTRHTELRRDFARVIFTKPESSRKRVQNLIVMLVADVFQHGRRGDLVRELLRPLCDALFSELVGTPPPPHSATGPSTSQIFDRCLGLNRRKAINAQVSRLQEAFSANSDRLTTSVDHAVALTILGYDSLLGSLGGSLLSVLQAGAGARLCDLTYPRYLTHTGVPYIERVATKDVVTKDDVNEWSFQVGDRVRLFLDASLARDKPTGDPPYFGRGKHLCLGKELSLWLWQTLTAEVSKIPVIVDVTSACLRHRDYVFTFYDSIEVIVHE